MNVHVSSDIAILREANEVLLQHLGASKAARFWAAIQPGEGDYLKVRDELFAGETVDTLYEQVLAFRRRKMGEAGDELK
ncbi:MAG: hypothetical protein M1546_18020 [Chloroflexi bacterium]|nr:hypothetical protein [Chloroflexota bacterium]